MTKDLFLVAYEGHDRKVVNYAAGHAQRMGAKLHVAHILEWSPYSFLTPEELDQRHKRRQEELAKAQSLVMDPVLSDLKGMGLEAEGEIRYGNVVDLLNEIAEKQGAAMVFVGRSGAGSVASRLFGSVPIGLTLSAPVPVVVVP